MIVLDARNQLPTELSDEESRALAEQPKVSKPHRGSRRSRRSDGFGDTSLSGPPAKGLLRSRVVRSSPGDVGTPSSSRRNDAGLSPIRMSGASTDFAHPLKGVPLG